MSEELRGFQAAAAHYLKKGRAGGGKRDANGALNVAHTILVAAGRPMGGGEIVVHALGLGLWASNGKTPVNNIVRVLDIEAGKDTGIIFKPGPGLFLVKDDVPAPLPITPHDVDRENATLYAEMIEAGAITALKL